MADRGKKARERPREAQKLALRQHPPRNCARIPRLDECGRGLLLLLAPPRPPLLVCLLEAAA
eukprot:COSAG06_NODE_5357_length_3529_cov_2.579883_1_plen_61_part_10